MPNQVDVVIVGGGIAALMAARHLAQSGRSLILLDKANRVGGRMATRPMGRGIADHGAQFFTTRDREFEALVSEWAKAGLVFQWSSGWSDGSTLPPRSVGYPRYAVKGGMNALPAYLAKGLDVRSGVVAMSARMAGEGWEVLDEAGRAYQGRALLLTPPVPQSLAILDGGGARMTARDRGILSRIEYDPCLCGLYEVEGDVALPEPGAVQKRVEPVLWMADNRAKGVSEVQTLTVHAGPVYSNDHWDEPDQVILDELLKEVQPFMGAGSRVVEAQLKRWRYAIPVALHNEHYLLADAVPPLAFAGDAFGGPRVEGAALSGLWAGRALAQSLEEQTG